MLGITGAGFLSSVLNLLALGTFIPLTRISALSIRDRLVAHRHPALPSQESTPGGILPLGPYTPPNIGLDHTKGLLVTLKCCREQPEHPLGRDVVHDDPLGHRHGDVSVGKRRGVEPQVENQFFGSTGNSTEVRISSRDTSIVHGDPLLDLTGLCLGFGSLSRGRLRFSFRGLLFDYLVGWSVGVGLLFGHFSLPHCVGSSTD